MDYSLDIINNFSELHADYRAMCSALQSQLAFDQTLVWFEELSNYALDDLNKVLLFGVRNNDREACLLFPVLLSKHGDKLNALATYYSSSYSPIIDSSKCDPAAALTFLVGAIQKIISKPSIVDINPLEHHGNITLQLSDALESSGYLTASYFRFGNWYLEVNKRVFKEYFDSLPSRVRNTVERKTAKLKREKPYVIEVFSDPEGLEKALDDYKKIYSLSWKVEEPYPEFIINIARKFAALGWLRLGLIYVEGEPAAAQIWFVKDGTASIFKLAYDEKYKQLSVGSILTTELMRRAIDEDKVAIIDYLTGDDSYKSEWMSHRRERVGLVGFSYTSLNGILHAARHFAGVWVRRFK